MKRKRMILLFGIFLCVCTGCRKQIEPVTEEVTEEELSYFPHRELQMGETLPLSEKTAQHVYDQYVTDQGIFFFSMEDSLLKYEDWENQTVYPLCGKANCMHDSEECTAWFSPNKMPPTALFYDGTYLYFEKNGEKNETIFYRQNLDGTNRKKIFEVAEDFSDGVIYEGDRVYYLTSSYKTDQKEWDSESTPQVYHLHCGNLKEEKTERLSFQWSISNGELLLLGKFENQAAFRQSTETGEKFFLLNLETGEKTGFGEGMTLQTGGFEEEAMSQGVIGNFILDIESSKKKERNGYEYYPCKLVLESLHEQCAYEFEKTVWNIWDLMILDNRVFYYLWDEESEAFLQAAYEFPAGKETVYDAVFEDFYIWGETENWFYGSYYESPEEYTLVRILKEDFYSGKPDFIERQVE